MILDETPDRLGDLTEAVAAALAELRSEEAVARLWSSDHTLWRPEATEISDRLGWLTVVPEMMAQLEALRTQCDALVADVDHVLVMGMGGSSLFPEVMAQAYGPVAGRPRLHVLDTTDPAAIARAGEELPPERTLHLAASKSGTTLETACQLEWAWGRMAKPNPSRFAVITDPGSELAGLAEERGFAAVWLNRPDIGGRYSALSYFGLVPAVLAGADVDGMLASASATAERLRGAPAVNPGAKLAAVLAAGVRNGRDKVTLVLPQEIASFGLWLEQLLAESTGKDGTGVVPVVGEPLGDPDVYEDDRVFVALADSDQVSMPNGPALEALAQAGHPVWVEPYDGLAGLGGQVLLWEVATALCGALLDIQPFDQPDVAAAKSATNRVLAEVEQAGVGAAHPANAAYPGLEDVLGSVQPGDYLAIQAFVDPDSEVVGQLEAVRLALRNRLRVATTLGLGPRYLHSTGQLHKGGPATGVFLQVAPGLDGEGAGEGAGAGAGDGSGAGAADWAGPRVAIPGRPYDFRGLIAAQAAGDLATLRERGRQVTRVGLDQLLAYAR